MTKELECFCVQCLSLVTRDAAEVVFRTGFYRVTVPLGHCRACAGAERAAAMIQRQPTAEGRGHNAMLA